MRENMPGDDISYLERGINDEEGELDYGDEESRKRHGDLRTGFEKMSTEEKIKEYRERIHGTEKKVY